MIKPQHVAEISGKTFDVTVIGGGINGTAIARRFAHAGYSVLLIEQGEFGCGSSSRSSRIMHCGLNYLAEVLHARSPKEKIRNLGLARRMMIEREKLWRELPGRLVPRPFLIPIRVGDAVGPLAYDLAFRSLRLLGGYRLALNYRRFSGRDLQDHPCRPWFGPDLIGLVEFSELVFEWPEGICHDYAIDAAEQGAKILNYTELCSACRTNEGWSLRLRDVSGEVKKPISVKTTHVINMSGVGSDAVNQMSPGLDIEPHTVTRNKGCHIAMRLPPVFAGHGILRRNALGHLFLAVPWQDFHIIGPTETAVTMPEVVPRVTMEDISTLLAAVDENLPGIQINTDAILASWAGYRPAAFSKGNSRGEWQRRIHLASREGNKKGIWLSMAWGRLADHRITANEVFDHVAVADGRTEKVAARLPAVRPRLPDDWKLSGGAAPRDLKDVMFARLGLGWSGDLGRSSATRIAQMMSDDPDMTAALVTDYNAWIDTEFLSFREGVAPKVGQ